MTYDLDKPSIARLATFRDDYTIVGLLFGAHPSQPYS
jgi:hypothetical protein